MTPELIKLLQQNRMEEARALCAQLCRTNPGNAQIQFIMSAIHGQLNEFAESEKFAQKAIKLNPTVPEAHVNLGIAQLRLNKINNAIRSLLRALELRPTFPEACQELANAYQQLGKIDKAINYYHRAIELRPNYADALCNLAAAQIKKGNITEAQAKLKAALSANPRLTEAHIQLALAARNENDTEQAILHLKHATAIKPDHPEANLSLGELYAKSNPESAVTYCNVAAAAPTKSLTFLTRLAVLYKQLGHLNASIKHYRQSLRKAPRDIQLLTNLGVTLNEAGNIDEAIRAHNKALSIDSEFAEAHYNLGIALSASNRQEDAEKSYRNALALKPELAEAWNNLGSLLLLQGNPEEAIDCFHQALAKNPDYLLAASNRLFTMNYLDSLPEREIFIAHKQWGESFLKDSSTATLDFTHQAHGKTLRIGFISSDFRSHSVAYFFESLLSHNDSRIEIYCYSNTLSLDKTSERIRRQADYWRDITSISDHEAAHLIHKDSIDVLIDLSGHTSGHRLGVFALRPCRTQITYLGYPNTTGLNSIDYRITDIASDPEENKQLYTEKLLYLEQCFLCYTPPLDSPTPTDLKHNPDHPIIFGSFNNLAKITPTTIRLWSKILTQLPKSILIIKNRPLSDRSVANRIYSQFSEYGIPAKRLRLLPWSTGVSNHLNVYNQIDIALDTYPYTGTTTTCESLWMQRPVITLRGKTHASRVSASLLTAAGLDELIADSEQNYIECAINLAQNLNDFCKRYPNIREQVKNSILCDHQSFQKRFFDLVCKTAKANA